MNSSYRALISNKCTKQNSVNFWCANRQSSYLQIGVQVGFLVYSVLKVVRRFVRCGAAITDIIPPDLLPFNLTGKKEYVLKYANYAASKFL